MVVALIYSFILSVYVVVTFENPVNYRQHLMNTTNYPWVLTQGGEISKGDYSIIVRWTDEQDMRLQLFDENLNSPPFSTFVESERIPQGSSRIQFDFHMHAPIGINIWFFLLQYDEKGRILEADRIEQLHTTLRHHAGQGAQATSFRRTYSFDAQVHSDAETFRVMMQIRPSAELANSQLSINHMYLVFR